MSEESKRCSLCEEGEFIPVCDVCGAIGTNTRAYEAELAALREENERLRQDANPWRYPSRGELPEREDFYLVTCGKSGVEICYWREGKWHGKAWEESDVRAWRERDVPAPELEDK